MNSVLGLLLAFAAIFAPLVFAGLLIEMHCRGRQRHHGASTFSTRRESS